MHIWLWFTLAVLTIFLGTRGLNEPDEGRYAEIAREMVVSGEWLVPHLNGFEHFQKPPFFYWLTALSVRVFGVNEWAVRFVPAMAGLGMAMLTFFAARKLWDTNVAVRAVLILVSSIEFFVIARLVTPDMTLAFWTTAAIAALVFRKRWLFFVAMGFGFLNKGPLALVVPICCAASWLWNTRRDPDRLRLPWVRGLLITLAIGLSWFVVLSMRSPVLFDYFWRYELVQRFTSSTHGRSRPFWFFVPVILAGMLPWTLFAWKPLRATWQRIRTRDIQPRQALLLGWVLPPFLILSISGSKLPTYLLPLVPAIAIALAVGIKETKRVWWIAGTSAALWLALIGNFDHSTPYLRQQASTRSLAALLKAQPDYAQAKVFSCEVRAHGFEFYLGRTIATTREDADIVLPTTAEDQARLFESPKACARELADGQPAYGLVRKDRFTHTFLKENWRVIGQAGDFILIRNHPGDGN